MATGYTQGIIDGSIKTFKEFALGCARAFGAASHMKDDDLSVEYKKRTPGDFYDKTIKETEEMAEEIKSLSDEKIIKKKKENIEKSIKRHEKSLKEKKELEKTLNGFLFDAKNYTPPTEDHKNIKKFMIEQLEDTIKWNCDITYDVDEIERLKKEISNLNAERIRNKYLSDCFDSLNYYFKEKEDEIKRCENSNNWYDEFFKSLE